MSRLRFSHCVAVLAVSGLLFGIAGTANAKLIDFHGTLSVGFSILRPIVATGSGSALLNGSIGGLGGHLTTLQILTNTVSVTGTLIPITDPEAAPLLAISGSAALGMGVLRPISGAAASGAGLTQNVLPVAGAVRLCFLVHCSTPPIPLTVGGTQGVGFGGLVTLNTFGTKVVKFSIYGQPWTVKTALVTGIPTANGGFSTTSVFGFAHGPASATSSTAAISGVVQLVTATRVVSTLGAIFVTPQLTTLRIHLVPEPGTFLLFGSGVVALGFAGRRQLRRSRPSSGARRR